MVIWIIIIDGYMFCRFSSFLSSIFLRKGGKENLGFFFGVFIF